MTTVTGSDHRVKPADGPVPVTPSVAARRARALLVAGLAGAHVTAAACIGIFVVTDGLRGAVSAALAAGMVVLFYSVGHLVQVWYADAPARDLMRVSMASYIARVTALGGLLALYFAFGSEPNRLLGVPVLGTAITTVVGWLVAEAYTFRRLRIPNFDEPIDDLARTATQGPRTGESAT